MSKRIFDLVFASAGLIVLAPVFAAIALWIKLDSPGPVFFRQVRVGQHGKPFRIHKFRTMAHDPSPGQPSALTIGADPRITRSGRFLRKHKLDELAQLIDVVQGKMSLVGPRPEVPKYVAYYPDALREIVLSVKPGITDEASLRFKDESDILGRSPAPEKAYVEEILPAKLEHYARYARDHSLAGDLVIIVRTLRELLT
jgi:lipopolysaccharide/colanic/teichoic acid biosynthesis glycosyltransferase